MVHFCINNKMTRETWIWTWCADRLPASIYMYILPTMKVMKWVRCTWSREILVNAHDLFTRRRLNLTLVHSCETFVPHVNRISTSGSITWLRAFLLHLWFSHFQIYTYIYINGTLSFFQKVRRSGLVFTYSLVSRYQQLPVSPPLQQIYLMRKNKASSLMLYIYMHLLTHTSNLAIPQDPDKRALF